MKKSISKLWQRFSSAVPPLVKKFQVVLTLAGSTLTAGAAINWPSGLASASTFCAYAAAICAATVLGLQFTQQAVSVLEDDKGGVR